MNYNFIDFQIQNETPQLQGSYKIAESASKAQIQDNYRDISDLLDKMNLNIQKIFKKQEEQLLNYYKDETDKAQDQLKQLAELTSDSQLKKKVQKKKEEIEQERQKILQSSMEFSNKCKEYKDTLLQVMNTTKDLEAEIIFLDDQIESATESNLKLKKKLQGLNNKTVQARPQNNIQKSKEETTTSIINISKEQSQEIDIEIAKAKQQLQKKVYVLQQLEQIQSDSSLDINNLEKIFLECVQKIKSQKQQNDLKSLLMQSKRPRERPEFQAFRQQIGLQPIRFKQEIQRIDDFRQQQSMEEQVYREDQFFSDAQLTDQHKRQIMNEFLSRGEVKILIYSLIFQNGRINQNLF